MTRILDVDTCPHCKGELAKPVPRACHHCGGSLQKRYLSAGCLTSKPMLVLFAALLYGLIEAAARAG